MTKTPDLNSPLVLLLGLLLLAAVSCLSISPSVAQECRDRKKQNACVNDLVACYKSTVPEKRTACDDKMKACVKDACF